MIAVVSLLACRGEGRNRWRRKRERRRCRQTDGDRHGNVDSTHYIEAGAEQQKEGGAYQGERERQKWTKRGVECVCGEVRIDREAEGRAALMSSCIQQDGGSAVRCEHLAYHALTLQCWRLSGLCPRSGTLSRCCSAVPSPPQTASGGPGSHATPGSCRTCSVARGGTAGVGRGRISTREGEGERLQCRVCLGIDRSRSGTLNLMRTFSFARSAWRQLLMYAQTIRFPFICIPSSSRSTSCSQATTSSAP